MRVKANAKESWVRFQPNALSIATNHIPIEWKSGTLVMMWVKPGQRHEPPTVIDALNARGKHVVQA